MPARDISLDLEISKVNALVQTFLDPGTLSSLKQAVASVQEITETLAENNAKLGSLIENTERASTRFAPLLDSSNRSLEALQTQILPEAYRALDQLETLSDSLNGAVTEIVRDPSLLLRGRGEAKPGPGE